MLRLRVASVFIGNVLGSKYHVDHVLAFVLAPTWTLNHHLFKDLCKGNHNNEL